MRLSRHRKRVDLAFNMTPMIDIVFLLIIFFMTVSQITRVNEELLELPKQKGVEEVDPETYTVNIRNDGTLVISGRQVDTSEAILFISQELAEKGGDPSAIRVLIRCDRRATTDSPNELVRRLVDLGIRQVRVTVEVANSP